MNDLLATLSPGENQWISAEALDDQGGALTSLLDQFRRAQHELECIDKCLGNLAEAHQRSSAIHTAEASTDLRDTIQRNAHLILLKSRRLQASLNDLALGPEEHPSLQRIRASLAMSMTKSLKDRMNLFSDLRENIEADYREAIQRHCYIVSGQILGEEAVDRIMESGQSQNLLKQAIADGQEGVGSILDLEEREDGMRDLQRDLQELQQIFVAMAALVLDQGDDMDDIEKNVADSASALNAGVAKLGDASKSARGTSKWIWGAVILLLIFIVVLAIVLVVVSLVRRGRSYALVVFGFAV